MHSPSLWYETEVRNFLMIIFLRNIEILYLECVSTNDYMLILHCLALFGPKPLFLSFSFSLICCNCVMGQKHSLSNIERDLGGGGGGWGGGGGGCCTISHSQTTWTSGS